VKFGLEHTGDATKLVLDGAGDAGEGVSLHFTKADQTIAFNHPFGKGKLFDQVSSRKDWVTGVSKSARGTLSASATGSSPA